VKLFSFDKIRKEIERQTEIIKLIEASMKIKEEIVKNKYLEIQARLATTIDKMLEFSEQAKRNTP